MNSRLDEKRFLLLHLKCFGDLSHDFFCSCPLKKECDEEALRRLIELAEGKSES